MRTVPVLLALGIVGFAAPAGAQKQKRDSTVQQRRQASLVLDHTFTSAIGEPVRVFLAKDATYHVELQGSGLQIQLTTLLGSMPKPLIEPLLAGLSAGDESIYEVKPRADAIYVFTTLGGDAARPVAVHVYAVQQGMAKKP